MYENNMYEPSEQELKWTREHIAEKERDQKEKREVEYKEELKNRVNRISKYGNAKVNNSGRLCNKWYCPHCNRWFHAWHESSSGGVTETSCNYCGVALAHSYMLD